MSQQKNEMQNITTYKPFRVYDGNAIFIGGYVMMFLLQFIFMVVLTVTGVEESFTSTMLGTCLLLLFNEAAYLSEPFLYGKIKGYNPIMTSNVKNKLSVRQIVLIIIISVLVIVAFMPLANLFGNLIINLGFLSSSSIAASTFGELVLLIIFAALLPSLGEEFLFRGSMAKAYREKGYCFAILFSSIMFALMHGNPLQLIHQFFLGIVCAFIFFATKSIWSSVILHFTNNFIALVGDYVMRKNDFFVSGSTTTFIIYALMVVLGILALVLMLHVFLKDSIKRSGKEKECNSISKKGVKKVFAQLTIIFDEEDMKRAEDIEYENKLQTCENEEEKEVITRLYIETRAKAKKKDRNSIFFALGIVLVIWIFNTLQGFLR